ncbi:MAG: asparagine synthase (glutamine-hydrolyzing) [Erysipelotrichaceae bacterium]
MNSFYLMLNCEKSAIPIESLKKNTKTKNHYDNFKIIEYNKCKYHVVVDGELYNQEEVMNALKIEHKSVEEVILIAYKTWGVDCNNHLNGSYAYVIDNEIETFVSKDHLGNKPIFYARIKNKGLLIANSINQLLECGIAPIIDKESLLNLFAFGPSIPEDKTLFRDIHALGMGQYMVCKHNNIRIKKYYEPKVKKHEDTLVETIAHVRYLVEDAILKQMKGCNASFLSGGLDSSIISAVCAKNNPNWHTYSLDYEGNNANFKKNNYQVSLDQDYIKQMVDHLHSNHTYLTIEQSTLVETLDDALFARNVPGMGDIDASLLWLCKQVKACQDDVILSGECADEIFGGYPWFYRDELKDLKTFPWLSSSEKRILLLNEKIKDLNYQGYLEKHYQKSVDCVEFLGNDSSQDQRARIHTSLCLHWFMQTLITRQHCMSNAAGLIIRTPFSDKRILDYVYNIPWEMKFLLGEEKGILRKAFEDILPEEITHRKKNPYPKTHNPIYTQFIQKRMEVIFNNPDSILHSLFDHDKLLALIQSGGSDFPYPWYGQLMSGPQLLSYLYQIDLWANHYHIQLSI